MRLVYGEDLSSLWQVSINKQDVWQKDKDAFIITLSDVSVPYTLEYRRK